MCGRYMLARDAQTLAAEFDMAPPAGLTPRYNIAPSQPVLIVRQEDQRRYAALVKWGLVPFWADDLKIGNRLLNARSETVASKPAFRAAFKQRRCLVPADGYYEWQTRAGAKQPFLIAPTNQQCCAIAGVWERWERAGNVLESCALLTCAANETLRVIHDRMPVVIARSDYADWLDPQATASTLCALLRPAADDWFTTLAVSMRVNSPRHDSGACIEPLARAP